MYGLQYVRLCLGKRLFFIVKGRNLQILSLKIDLAHKAERFYWEIEQ